MTRMRRTEVTIETDEITIVRRSQEIPAAPCPECAETVAMITPEQAAMMSRTSIRLIYRWLEAGWVHYSETPEGLLLVCPDSVLRLAPTSYRAD